MLTGVLKKLVTRYRHDAPIEYYLPLDGEHIPLNDFVGKEISLRFLREIYCIQCQHKIASSFQQGYCYPCYVKLADCNMCLIHPQRCKYPQKECPDTWAHQHCKLQHIVYIANSSGIKIGITRVTEPVTRWIDQGAIQALPLFKVANRQYSGLIEMAFKKYAADKTNWRKMLSTNLHQHDMKLVRNNLLEKTRADIEKLSQQFEINFLDEEPRAFTYPVLEFPYELNTLTFNKTPILKGKLLGIKGQYLLLESGVINIRKHAAYKIAFG